MRVCDSCAVYRVCARDSWSAVVLRCANVWKVGRTWVPYWMETLHSTQLDVKPLIKRIYRLASQCEYRKRHTSDIVHDKKKNNRSPRRRVGPVDQHMSAPGSLAYVGCGENVGHVRRRGPHEGHGANVRSCNGSGFTTYLSRDVFIVSFR